MNAIPSDREKELFRSLKVLVVEDSAEMRRLLTALLSAMGIGDVIAARDGISGLKIAAEKMPDLIITDGAMLPMDGHEMTRRIREGEATDNVRDVPVLMISGHIGRETVDLARDNGVTDYIGKPVMPELLYRHVLNAVSKPIHIVETPTYRGLSPTRRLTVASAYLAAYGDLRK